MVHSVDSDIDGLFCCSYTTPTGICTLSLHDALPIFRTDLVAAGLSHFTENRHQLIDRLNQRHGDVRVHQKRAVLQRLLDRKSTRLNSSHPSISYAVFCLKKKSITWLSRATLRSSM